MKLSQSFMESIIDGTKFRAYWDKKPIVKRQSRDIRTQQKRQAKELILLKRQLRQQFYGKGK